MSWSKEKFPTIIFGLGNYLIISSRTGKYQSSKTIWPIHNDREEKNQGVAGKAWYRFEPIVVEDLPDINEKDTLKKYSECSYTNEKVVIKLNVKSRSFLAIPVEDVDGEKRGVIVVDSHNEKIQRKKEIIKQVTRVHDLYCVRLKHECKKNALQSR